MITQRRKRIADLLIYYVGCTTLRYQDDSSCYQSGVHRTSNIPHCQNLQ